MKRSNLSFIMTMPAVKDFITTWGSDLAFPLVMCTPKNIPTQQQQINKYTKMVKY